MRNEFRTLFISGLSEKKENHVKVPDLSVIITSGSLHPDCEARLWHALLQKLCLIAEHRKCTYLGGRGLGGAKMKKETFANKQAHWILEKEAVSITSQERSMPEDDLESKLINASGYKEKIRNHD